MPENLKKRQQHIADTDIPIDTLVSLNEDDGTVHVKVKILNRALDHRMRVLFKANIVSETSLADQQFGTITRPTEPEELKIWEEERWVEKPVPIYPMQSFVDIKDKKHGLALMTKGIREYEIVGEDHDTIALTLFRGVGHLGKPNLVNRPGRASGVDILTPDSQVLGELNFEFSICPHGVTKDGANVAKVAKEYLTPLIGYLKTNHTVFVLNPSSIQMPAEYSLFKLNSDLILSAAKKAENAKALVIRVFNSSQEKSEGGQIVLNNGASNVFTSDLLEQCDRIIDGKRNVFNIEMVNPCELKTFLLN